jgi:hypothetical protein
MLSFSCCTLCAATVQQRTHVRLPVTTGTLDSEDLHQGQVLPDVAYPSVVDVGHRQQPYVIALAQRNFREFHTSSRHLVNKGKKR